MSDHEQDNGPVELPGEEEAASLRMLGSMASVEDAHAREQADQEQAQADAQLMSMEQENEAALTLVADLAMPVFTMCGFPAVGRVLQESHPAGPTNGQMLAKAWAPVLTKHGISLGDLGGAYKAEIGALMVTVPIAGAIWAAVKEDTGRREKPVPKAVAEAVPVDTGTEQPIVLG